MQRSFAVYDGFRKQRKITRRGVFLAEMERVLPWRRLEALIKPHYPLAGRGRKPYRLSTMLRIHFLQHWYGYSDPGMEEALHDIPALRRFAGLDAGESRMPDETTILNFRHLLEAHQLAESLFQEVVSVLTEQGLILRESTIVDATLIAAPPSTKNQARQRDPEMTSSKKGNQWHFGMKAHIGVDTAHGLVHTLEVTTGKVSDYSMAETLLHGDEQTAHGDRGYADKIREPDRVRAENEAGPRWFVPFKRTKGCDTTPEQKRLNRLMAALRSAVEHPFRVLKRQFGYTKVRYRGLFKNEQHLFSQFALVNLYIARRVITPAV
ncbi:IS5 family transposase [Acidiphilium sp. PA]|uniref:IS5 family transposase n=1 Tax=Acidiphilium sp. PA TaxID=2871705 RepID=UPI002242D4BA|nr:IS5 family transposase [Acidiphilium sp. PA]MCW8308439.1 IS5 family transposase [Acidiphilium sp. PA]